MDATQTVRLIDELDPDEIRAELEQLSAQQDALRVLLRAALARRQRGTKRPTGKPEEVAVQ